MVFLRVVWGTFLFIYSLVFFLFTHFGQSILCSSSGVQSILVKKEILFSQYCKPENDDRLPHVNKLCNSGYLIVSIFRESFPVLSLLKQTNLLCSVLYICMLFPSTFLPSNCAWSTLSLSLSPCYLNLTSEIVLSIQRWSAPPEFSFCSSNLNFTWTAGLCLMFFPIFG